MITRNRVSSGRTRTDSEDPYWVSFSDLMAGLLVVFILALVFLMHQQRVATAAAATAKGEAEAATAAAATAKGEAEAAAGELDQALKTNNDLRERIGAEVKKLTEIEKIRIEILNEVEVRLNKAGIQIIISDNHSVLRIPEETLAFETAKWEIPSASKPSVELIGQAIHDAITIENRLNKGSLSL